MGAYHGGTYGPNIDPDGYICLGGGAPRELSVEEITNEQRRKYRNGVMETMRKLIMQDFENMGFERFMEKYPLR
ncbi:MAG: hypothetical protein HY365_01730 [Candidatus Aenigmarchaeota archaeon]|nr:hypothetical protein [Candidatus Aenigmarchaeota archaeon]